MIRRLTLLLLPAAASLAMIGCAGFTDVTFYGSPRAKFPTNHSVRCFAYSTDGACVVTAGREPGIVWSEATGVVRVWDAQTGSLRAGYQRAGYPFDFVALAAEGKVVAAGFWGRSEIILWDANGQERVIPGDPGLRLTSMAFTPSNELAVILVRDPGRLSFSFECEVVVRFYDPSTLNPRTSWNFTNYMGTASLSRDGRSMWWTDAESKRIGFRDFEKGVHRLIPVQYSTDCHAAVSMESDRIIVERRQGKRSSILTWSTLSGETLEEYRALFGSVYDGVFSADGQAYFRHCGKELQVWDPIIGKPKWSIVDPEGSVGRTGMKLSPDGRSMALLTAGGELEFWNVSDLLHPKMADPKE